MKNKVLALLLTVALICSVLCVVACTPKNQETWPINIANFWAGNEDEETYTVRTGEDGASVVISYEKSGEWQWVRRSFATEDAEQLANVKTLVLEGKMTTNTNDPRITLKIEYSGDIAAKEVHFYMSETVAIYEWDLSDAQLDKAVRLLIFAEGSRVSAEGSIEISRFQLTNEAINEANDVTKQTPVVETKVNQITAENKTVNAGWYDNGDGVYTISQDGTAYNVSYDKKSFSWALFYALVKGDALAQMKTFSITVQGAAGQVVMVKPYDKVEAQFTLTGGEDVIQVDLTKVQDVDFTAELKIMVFAQPNTIDVSGSFKILNAEFSTEQLVAQKAVNEITADSKTVNAGWYDSKDNVYTIEKDGTAYNVSFDKGATEWSTFEAIVKGEAIGTMKTIKVTVQGTKGEEIMIKPFNKVEQRHTFTGDEDVVVVDISGVTDVDFTEEQQIFIFGAPGTSGTTGSFKILNVEFSTDEATPAPAPTPTQTVSPLESIASSLKNDGTSTRFTISGNKLTYTTAGWDTAVGYVNVDGVNTIAVTVKGISGHTAIIKIGSVEQKFEASSVNGVLSGEEQTVTFDVSALSGVQEFRVFADWDAWTDIETVPGELTIVSVRNMATIDSIASSLINANDAGRFTINGNKLTYTTAGWDTAVGYVNVDGVNTIAVTVKGISGHTAIIKIGSVEQKFEASSANGVLSGEEQTVTFDVSALSGVQEFRVFADWDPWTDIATVEGELTIVSVRNIATIDNVASSLKNANVAGRFTIDGNKLTYTTAGWDTAVCYVNVDDVSTITVTVKGISGHTAIIKIGSVEQKFEVSSVNGVLSGEEQTVTFDVSALSGVQEFRVFADWDAWTDIATVSGELTIVSVVAA